MKLVISLDECGLNNVIVENTEAAVDMVYDFLGNQFPEWNIDEVFDLDNAEFDYTNCECHIPMGVIE
jgi:hypothetical protein